MDQPRLAVLLIEDDPDYAALVEQWLSATTDDGAFVLNWTDSLASGLDRLAQGGLDIILLDLSLPDSDGRDTFLAIRARAPSLPIVILSAAASESLALQLIQQGAEDYLVKSACSRDLLVRTVRYTVIRRKRQGADALSQKVRVLGVVGAKGGVGTSTVACNLAASLREQTGQPVLLADLDVNAGQAAFLLGLDPQYTLLDAVANLDRLDRDCWESIVARGPGDLDVVASPSLPGHDEFPLKELHQVLESVRPFYQWIVLDLGQLSALSMSVLPQVDEILLVTTTTLPALHGAKRVIDAMVSKGVEQDRLRLIMNRTEAGQTLSGSELNRIFGVRVYARLPYDSEELHRACLQRKLPGKASEVGRQFGHLARKVAGLHDKRSLRNLPILVSLVGRFRKSQGAVRTNAD